MESGWLKIRVPSAELAQIRDAAAKAGYGDNVSLFVRRKLFAALGIPLAAAEMREGRPKDAEATPKRTSARRRKQR